MMLFDQARRLRWLLWAIPGLLMWAAFPPMGEATDIFFALAPLLWCARRSAVRESRRRWALAGLVFWVATLAWMPAIIKNGGPWPLVVLGWGALAAYCTLYFAAFGDLAARYWQWAKARRNYAWRLLGLLIVEPLLWAGLELVRSRFLGGFAWNQLGVAVAHAGFPRPGGWGGVYLLSAVAVLVNGTFASIAERMWKPGECACPKPLRSLETLLPLALALSGYLLVGWERGAAEVDTEPLDVALVQRNCPCVFSAAEREESPVAVYSNLVAAVAPLRPQLVVLAESAMCEFGELDRANARAWARQLGRWAGATAVLAGGSRSTAGRLYNSAALYDAANGMQIYDKVHLVPFGEFIPGDDLIPALKRLAPVGSCTAGELRLLDFTSAAGRVIRLGVAICYEDTDSAQVRSLAARGAQALVFITNDSWFSHSDEAVQHAWQAVARAVETGLPVIRVGNSGVTGVVLPNGAASWLMDAEARPLVDAVGTRCDRVAVPVLPRPTLYVRWGDAPLAVAFALLLLAMAGVGLRARRQRRVAVPPSVLEGVEVVELAEGEEAEDGYVA